MSPPRRLLARVSPSALTGGAPVMPLLILFGLYAMEQTDIAAFNLLTPEIRDAFHLKTKGILSVIGGVSIVAFGAQVLVGYYADRYSRTRIAVAGALVWSLFTLLTGVASTVAMLVVVRSLSGVGRAINDPTHNSLIADYYEPSVRIKVYGFHRAATPIGLMVGSLIGGLLAYLFDWRAPFLAFGVPTTVLAVLALKLKEPVRGAHERRAMGASEETALTEEHPPSLGEAWRICYQVKTLRRLWYSLPFVAAGLFGIQALTAIFYEDVFGLNEYRRGLIAAGIQPFGLVGILVGIPIATRMAQRNPGLVMKFLAVVASISAAALVGFARAPNLPTAIVMNLVASSVLGVLSPGFFSVMSLAIPPRARSLGFSIGSLYLLPGIFILALIGGVADEAGVRNALLLLVPVFLLGIYILASSGGLVASDIDKVRASTLAQAEVLAARRRGEVKLLLVKDLDVAYDGVQVLFDVNFEVDEGEIIALLGTNGAGKSTLLKAISGLIEAQGGAVVFDGRDCTYALPHELAARGVIQMPGGRAIFPTVTVEEHLRVAGWLYRKDQGYMEEATKKVLGLFPALREKLNVPAATLSGGQQQMLAVAMAFIAKPRLLMIDELSLGLAPAIVEQLLEAVKAFQEQGTTVILVEQSVNLALTVAQTAYFMEKGEIRFHGPTPELLGRPDILRSVFLEGGASREAPARARPQVTASPKGVVERNGRVLLETRGLTKRFSGITAIDDLSIALHEGEILGVIGPNGAGKTTLFDLISGFLIPDQGTILLDGGDVTRLRPDTRSHLGLARSFQDARIFGALTVHQAMAVALDRQLAVKDPVAAALHLPEMIEAEEQLGERVEELIELMGLSAFRDKFVSELSTGSRRIVDLACQVAMDPRVILLDEPSSGIAQRETEALGPLLLRTHERTGASLLVIEHDMPLIAGIADRIVALDLGRLVTEGDADHVLNHPHVVASYLGTSRAAIERSGSGSRRPTRTRTTRGPRETSGARRRGRR